MKKLFLLIVLFCIAIQLFAADDWTDQNPTNPPAIRRDHSMSFISEGKVILFGGYSNSTFYGDTWIYDVNQNLWTDQNPAVNPPARQFSAIAYAGEDKVMMYSGELEDYSELPDTWIYDLSDNNWTDVTAALSPLPLSMHALAYIGDNHVLLFGGQYSNDETWIFDADTNSWTQVSPDPHPSGRWYHSMSYIGEDKVMLFGGNAGGTDMNDTWIYDLSENSWTEMVPVNAPCARATQETSYLGEDKVVLFAGATWPTNWNDTWIYDLSENNWVQDDNNLAPEARFRHTFCESSMDGSTYPVMFGGLNDDDEMNDTWTFGGGDYLNIDPHQIPHSDYFLYQNYPNPFNPITTINFELDNDISNKTDLVIYNLKGQKIRTFSNLQNTDSYNRQVVWNGNNQNNQPVSSGIYFFSLMIDKKAVHTKKMVLMK